ncbi:MAG: D-glycero-beta-D-manno-heptose 1-phosphate adenylyltransferase, partial [Planctomycetes bacterium]|nr:D-glycero-beta-D-manno-heptose 1-phosphate adenylyltransferase [Planctomycetota bacterium]
EDTCAKMIKAARKAKVPVVVDPKGRDYSKYKGATAITPNRLEAETATGLSCAEDRLTEACAKRLQSELNLEVAFITLGADGVALLPKKGSFSRIPTEARSVFDVTGAGDTFIATLGTFMAQGASPEACAALANTASGIKVSKFGAAAITRDEVRRAIVAKHHAFDYHAKILEHSDLKEICRSLREAGRRIVFTNGCFDILHAGHVTYLNFCRARGDVLVLGLNSDASVRRQGKGEERPINNQDDRARVLAALADVDFISVFDEDTPTSLISIVKPHVLVKGADWEGKEVAGASTVKKLGGEVVFAPLLEGRSTTNIVRKMQSP